jgi:hypothetical protein
VDTPARIDPTLPHDRPARQPAPLEVLVQPGQSDPLSPVEVLDVRLDAKERRAVERVHLGKVEPVPVDPLEPHDRQAQVVGTVRTPDGEDTVGLVLEEGSALNLLPVWATEVVDEDQMAELVQILQTGHLLLLELDPNLDVFLQTVLDGYLPGARRTVCG